MFAVQEQENVELLSVIQTFKEALLQSKFPNFSSQRSFMETIYWYIVYASRYTPWYNKKMVKLLKLGFDLGPGV